ncbi:ECF transporter S component [Sutcliffiella halmapala]|uniref:ECF transporter S component n=1 Tax=Sutcliffiella halmapala TaxID=79882 RepID=UPI00099582A9|nr:ECF transporter S component [Sutcliffiella halmapala]
MSTRKIALLGVFIALCVVGRLAFVSIPNVQPVTAIIIICSFWMGPISGVILAAGSTLATNLVLGSGTWTITQIIAWSTIGVMSGLLGKWFKKTPVIILAIYAGVCGLLYGFVVSLERVVIGKMFWPYYLAGLPFDINHAIGNVIFFLILFPILTRLLRERAEYMLQ